ncbi:hypothetical protein [Streptomyces sp. NPDC093149]|uniref:hypothetical protein n=1 Tax=Streptomyces sp. NPDC093149 TaxID=3366031 RepID=UPI0037FDFAE5
MTSMEAYSTARTGTLTERLAAAAGLTLAPVLLRLPFRHTVRAPALPATLAYNEDTLESEDGEFTPLRTGVRHFSTY